MFAYCYCFTVKLCVHWSPFCALARNAQTDVCAVEMQFVHLPTTDFRSPLSQCVWSNANKATLGDASNSRVQRFFWLAKSPHERESLRPLWMPNSKWLLNFKWYLIIIGSFRLPTPIVPCLLVANEGNGAPTLTHLYGRCSHNNTLSVICPPAASFAR